MSNSGRGSGRKHAKTAIERRKSTVFKDGSHASGGDSDHGRGYEGWDFLPAFVHPAGEHGAPHEHEASGATIETICGGVDDSQPVEQYDGTLGVTVAYVNDHQSAVGQLQWNSNLASIYTNPGNVNGVRWCSGTLISCDLFLSAGHCFDKTGGGWTRPKVNGTTDTIEPTEIATNMHVNFNYQVDSTGTLKTEESFAVTELGEYRLAGLDFAIVRLAGNPGRKYGFTRIAPADANIGEMLCIIGHPQGLPKRIEAGPLTDLHGDSLGYNDIDTLGGNSGSGVLGPAGTIVGVHTNGGCNADYTGHNHGVRISSIIAASPVVSDLVATKSKFMDDGCRLIKLKFRDDTKYVFVDGKLKVLRDGLKSKIADGLPKGIGDVKAAGYDVRPIDRLRNVGDPLSGRARGVMRGRTPFVLSAPHHAAGFTSPGTATESELPVAELMALLDERGRELDEIRAALYEVLGEEPEEQRGCP